MKKIITKTFTAQAVIGLNKGYTNELISISDFKRELLNAQSKTNEETGIQLSTKVTPCEIIFLDQEEPSVTLEWIQYPKFPTTEKKLKEAILYLVEFLMEALYQNRIVIIFPDKTICLEKSDAIDPRIKFNIEKETNTDTSIHKTNNSFLYVSDDFGAMKSGVVYDSDEFPREISEDNAEFKIRSKNRKS
ncbi:hypothetical protein [Flavobacterium sp.]|uniref:hypothetical protein n=1 Tax=Flavobacterium sp. TaxID=239 RepID=UPI0025ED8BB8|nr:hypothetical protein [Flavobacterium sp.]